MIEKLHGRALSTRNREQRDGKKHCWPRLPRWRRQRTASHVDLQIAIVWHERSIDEFHRQEAKLSQPERCERRIQCLWGKNESSSNVLPGIQPQCMPCTVHTDSIRC